MLIAFLIVLVIALGLAVALYFQMKASRGQATEQQQLLTDYQRRVDEQQKLLDDYRALEKNFDSVGEGYEQALLAFDKMQEDTEKAQQATKALEERCVALQTKLNNVNKAAEIRDDMMKSLMQGEAKNDMRLAKLVGKITDLDDVQGDLPPLPHSDNILVTQVSDEAIAISGVDKIDYLKFQTNVDPVAAATMLSTNFSKAVRALTHLLDNALKFTSEGAVTLSVSVDMDKMQAIYTVEDTGAGIDPAEAEHVFEPYVKLNQFFDGQGIGLTVARNIARRLGGDLVLEQQEGSTGSRFVLSLPM